MQGEAGHVRLAARAGHRPVHGLDDVAADRRGRASVCSRPGFSVQRAGADLLGEPEPFELRGAAEHQPAQLRVFVRRARAQVGDAAALVGDIAQRAVEAGPALGLDLLLQRRSDLAARCAAPAPG